MDRLKPIHTKLTSTIALKKEEKVNRTQTMENSLTIWLPCRLI